MILSRVQNSLHLLVCISLTLTLRVQGLRRTFGMCFLGHITPHAHSHLYINCGLVNSECPRKLKSLWWSSRSWFDHSGRSARTWRRRHCTTGLGREGGTACRGEASFTISRKAKEYRLPTRRCHGRRCLGKTVHEIAESFGTIDILVCFAGIVSSVRALDYTSEIFRKICDVNTIGTFLTAQAVGR